MCDDDWFCLILGILIGAWFMFLGVEFYEWGTSKQECKKIGNVTICREVYTHVTKDPYIAKDFVVKEVEW